MNLSVFVDARQLVVNVPDAILKDSEEFFAKMDRDMDRGWMMGPEFVERPDSVQRCQIAADKLLGALSSANETMTMLMAGYILTHRPGVSGVEIDTAGEMLNTRFIYGDDRGTRATAPAASGTTTESSPRSAMSKPQAMLQAGKDVSKVYRSGRGYRFAVRDAASGEWCESPVYDSESEAEQRRLEAFRARFAQLTGVGR